MGGPPKGWTTTGVIKARSLDNGPFQVGADVKSEFRDQALGGIHISREPVIA